MALGAVLIVAALSLFVWNQREANQAEESVNEIMPQLEQQVADTQPDDADDTDDAPYSTEMTEVEIDGYRYIGYLSIPVLDLELPVMSTWSDEQLKIAPCRYAGSTKTDDIVIAAHNYVRHFGHLSRLSVGDTVTFTDMDGAATTYQVAVMDVLSETAVEEMTAGEYDLTLFTCTYGNRSRITVRCERTGM